MKFPFYFIFYESQSWSSTRAGKLDQSSPDLVYISSSIYTQISSLLPSELDLSFYLNIKLQREHIKRGNGFVRYWGWFVYEVLVASRQEKKMKQESLNTIIFLLMTETRSIWIRAWNPIRPTTIRPGRKNIPPRFGGSSHCFRCGSFSATSQMHEW